MLVDSIKCHTGYLASNMRSGNAFGSDGHLKMSIDIKNTIFRILQGAPRLSAYLATMVASLISDEVFPRAVYDEIVNEVNRKTDLDLDDMDIGVTAKDGLANVRTQTCEFSTSISPRNIGSYCGKGVSA